MLKQTKRKQNKILATILQMSCPPFYMIQAFEKYTSVDTVVKIWTYGCSKNLTKLLTSPNIWSLENNILFQNAEYLNYNIQH